MSPTDDDAAFADSSYEALRRKFGLSDSSTTAATAGDVGVSEDMEVDDNSEKEASTQTMPRRRRRTAVAEEPTIQTEAQNEPESETQSEIEPPTAEPYEEDSPVQSACPIASFSRTFPRYTINLANKSNSSKDPESEARRLRRMQRGVITKLTKAGGDANVGGLNPFGFVNGLVKGVWNGGSPSSSSSASDPNLRKSIEGVYSKEIDEGSFRWIATANDATTLPSLVDEEFVAAASFWRMASDLSLHSNTLSAQEPQYHMKWYLALSDTTTTVASNLCDILNWYAEYLERGDDKRARVVRAQLDTTRSTSIPIIQFTATSQNGEETAQSQQQLEQIRNQLPNAQDTESQTKAWVKRVLVQLGICPFTKSDVKSGQGLGDLGVPVANILYGHSSALSGGGGLYLLMAGKYFSCMTVITGL